MEKNRKEHSNIILVAMFILALIAVGSQKTIPEEQGTSIFEVDMTEMTMTERLIVIEEFVQVAVEHSGYDREEVDIEYYPEQQEEGVVLLEIFHDHDEIFIGYRIDADTKEVLSTQSGHFIPYIPPTEYGDGYLSSEECIHVVLDYVGFEYDEVDNLEIRDDQSTGGKGYIVSYVEGDYWWYITVDASDGRIKNVDSQLME